MFKLIMLLFTTLSFGCTKSGEMKSSNYQIRIIDGCEYIQIDDGILDSRVYSLTHKGDCTNPIHKKQ